MAKIKFRNIRMGAKNKKRLEAVNAIIAEYQEMDHVLTLRQLYYQLVSRDIVPNKQSEYSKLSTLLKEGRMAGVVDWDAIEDRLRKPQAPPSFINPEHIMHVAIEQYQLPRQQGQKTYLEVWVEKDALSGVLSKVTKRYHVPILVNRGYSSASAMFDSYQRFKKAFNNGQSVKILYLGDYDPSGIDMIRDITDRTTEFITGDYGLESDFVFKVEAIALTKEQIQLYKPPPNPAKVTDPRAKDFIKNHGAHSWEVDALRPDVLSDLLQHAILGNIKIATYDEIVSREQLDKDRLRVMMESL